MAIPRAPVLVALDFTSGETRVLSTTDVGAGARPAALRVSIVESIGTVGGEQYADGHTITTGEKGNIAVGRDSSGGEFRHIEVDGTGDQYVLFRSPPAVTVSSGSITIQEPLSVDSDGNQLATDFFPVRITDGVSFLGVTGSPIIVDLDTDPVNIRDLNETQDAVKVEPGNSPIEIVAPGGTPLNIRDLTPTRDEVKVEGDNADPVVVEQVINVQGTATSVSTATADTALDLVAVAATEQLVVFAITVTGNAATVLTIKIFEEDNGASPEVDQHLSANGGGFTLPFPGGWVLTQGKDLHYTTATTDTVKMTAHYKLLTGLPLPFTAGDFLLHENGDGFGLESGAPDRLLLDFSET